MNGPKKGERQPFTIPAKSLKYNRSRVVENGVFAVHLFSQCFQRVMRVVDQSVNGERSPVHPVNVHPAKLAQDVVKKRKNGERKIVHTVNATILHPPTPRPLGPGG